MDIQASIVVNRPAEAVFAYLSSEEHIAVLGQRAGFGQEANEGKVEGEGCYKLIAPFVAPDMRRQLQEGLREMKEELEAERD